MRLLRISSRPLAVAGLVLALAACAGGGTPPASQTPTPFLFASPSPTIAATVPATPSPTPAGAVGKLTDVQAATVQIESVGTFVDPEVGQMNNAAGRGTGFFIDASGLAVTNNHVVTGAAYLKVWIGGDQNRTYNAKVMGASECSDLALIQVEGVSDVPYLAWFDGTIEPGLEVYAAGYPLGDPQYTLKKGIVSKARANGDTNWASIDSVIEHDAATLPGNSGGPLVTVDGKVVGVNYASDQAGERFAISEVEVKRILSDFEAGHDVTSIGINGLAVADATTGLYGIWVSSVKSGAPADTAGVKPGDVITRLEGLVLSTDGTMGDFCRILRSRNAGSPMAVQVLRFDTKEVLEGQINGSRALTAVAALNAPTESPTATETPAPGETPGPTEAPPDYTGYQTVKDSTETLQMEVPKDWTDIHGGKWAIDNKDVGVGLNAATNVDKWLSGWDTPGIFIGASASLAPKGVATLLEENSGAAANACTLGGESDYSANSLKGRYRNYVKCGDNETEEIVLVAMPDDESYVVVFLVVIVESKDVTAANHVLNTFQILKDVP